MLSQFRQSLNWLLQQFQLKPGKPAIAASLQALVSVVGPLGVGVWIGHPAASTIAILGAWFVGLVNVEGVYRQQARAKIVALISITAMLFLANLVHGTLWLSALTTFLVMFFAGLVGLFGQAASSIGLTASIAFIVALAKFAAFPDWSTVLEQCALCLAGGLWSIALSLGIWQLHPYKPAIQSVANCYSALSQLVNSATERVTYLALRQNQLSHFLAAQDNFTQALTFARDCWAAAWTAQRAANLSANQLLILVEDTPLIANSVVALVEQVVITSDRLLCERFQPEIQQAIEQLASALQQMAGAIANGKSSVHLGDLDRALEALNHQQQTLQAQLNQRLVPSQADGDIAITSLSKICNTLTRLAEQIHADAELIAILQRGDASTTTEPAWRKAPLPPQNVSSKRSALNSILEPLRTNLTIHSVLFRHALRLAIVATIAEILASILQIPSGYWITLTAVVALKPNYGGTYQTTLQRVLGTILGGVIGIAIVTLIHNSWAIGGCLLLLIVAAVAVRPLSFSLFVTLLTPAIVLLLNVTSQAGWQIGVLRIADSLAGGILALLGSYLLFPQWERQQLPTQLKTTIRVNVAYFQQVSKAYLHPHERASADEIAPLRRQAALENTNMATAAQRLFSEPRHIQGDIEPITSLIFYIRRFFNSVTALAEQRQELNQEYQRFEFKQFTNTIVQVLEDIADALQQRQTPHPLPDIEHHFKAIHNPIDQLDTKGFDQIAYEVMSIHCAISRLQK